ncbi:hypothetical protein Q31b_52910 [Novipirellula aureliae]|uniref:Uncharacterized protein n=1 Tax=Novipirellula aureliae TaxID=2527966 RepID=A0A5C6DG91_9BACT|nr:hypothetical protein [Novipirellula aureliae]TWU35195.1 hypothetical protein Q31b_52910 [Novipirellula aureliae]
MFRNICIAAALLVIAIAGAPFLSVAKWIGHFTLTVDLNIASEIDMSTITYVECRNGEEADWLSNDRSGYLAGFKPPTTSTPDKHSVIITCSGDSGGYGLYDTYHQPNFLVVQYRYVDSEEDEFARKTLAIPAGRGPRSTTLTLP